MKKYIDLLTIGNLSPDVLKILSPLRARYNIVSCRSMASTELVNSSKLILQEEHSKLTINGDIAEPGYIEDYLENAICTRHLKPMDCYYSIAVNRANIHNIIPTLKEFGVANDSSVCILSVPVSEYKSVEAMPNDVQEFLQEHMASIEIIFSEYNYDYCRLIPAVKFMTENNLSDKDLIQLNLDITYSPYAIYKLNRLINETDDMTITNANAFDSVFDTAVLSNSLSYVKPRFFNNMLWDGLRDTVIDNSAAKYWHTFCLWAANKCKGNYYCKFEDVPFDNDISTASARAKSFYNELARMGINKLLIQ